MKRNTNNTSIITVGRKFGWLPLVAFAAILAGCTADDTLTGNVASDTPVAFTTGIESVALPGTKSPAPGTRTVIDENGQTGWTQGDAVGIFMLNTGGTMPDGILTGADNVKHNVAPSTGSLSPAGTPIYYPQSAKVDFIALYPYSNKGEGNGKITADYRYTVSVADQTNPATIDVLYARVTDRERSKTPVALNFGHVLSKIKLNIKLGEGLTGLAADKITAVTLTGMPASATLTLQDGTLTPGAVGDISALKEARPSAGVKATFTALVPPQAADSYTRSIVITVDGEEYTGTIPAAHAYVNNIMNIYPVTVQKSGIIVGEPEIGKWTTNDNGTGTAEILDMVRIPANTFMMGSPTTESGRKSDETLHQVTLTKDFYMSKYEITSQQYAEFLNDIGMAGAEIDAKVSYIVEGYGKQPLFKVNAWGWTPKWDEATQQWKGEATQPMLSVSWYGAKAYADWIGGALPTEAQWEYACRAGTATAYWFGDSDANLGEYAWYIVNSGSDAHLVGEKLPNPWGLYDMYGNAVEWCADWYDSGYYASSPEKDPIGPNSGKLRVVRGGSYLGSNTDFRSSYRYYYNPIMTHNFIGFRIVFVP